MRRLRLLLSMSPLLLGACAAAVPHRIDIQAQPWQAEAQILDTLGRQSAAWNHGDIDGFMQGYWNSEQLRFASGDSVTYGWAAAEQRYRKHYPDRAAMGVLEFSDLDVELLAPDAAVVFGHWALRRGHDQPHGLFTLVMRRTAEGWKITRDHTSAAAP